MAKAQQEDSGSDIAYHEREWRVQRLGWIVMLIFIIAALLGVFGEGVLSDKSTGAAGVATLKYERFARYASPVRIELTIEPAAVSAGSASFAVNETYLSAFEIESIVPRPRSVAIEGEWLRYTFDSQSAPATITLDLIPEKIGSRAARFKVGSREFGFDQFIYP